MINPRWILPFVLLTVLWVCPISATTEKEQTTAKSDKKDDVQKKDELKLEDLLPEKSLFGPSAGGTAFSSDGAYGAYLYRPYKERRHGNDLYIYDVEKGQSRRVTWASVMAKFQSSARKVTEDRIKKAKAEAKKDKKKDAKKDAESVEEKESQEAKKGGGDEDEDETQEVSEENEEVQKDQEGDADTEQDQEIDEEQSLKDRGDWVSDKDADDDKAPRYRGISRFEWSPVSNEILFESEGDVYRYSLADDEVTRLTHTRDRERSVDWLPDGSGYTYQAARSLMRMIFDGGTPRQLDPDFPNRDELRDYCVSPDGQCIAFVTSREIKSPDASKVEIANYRNRLMDAREVSRRVSDDPLPAYEQRVYLYQLSEDDDEKDVLTEVFKCELRMPDDMLKTPVWSPDSKKIAFLTFEQDPALVKVFEAKVPEKKDETEEESSEDGDKEKKSDDDKKVSKEESDSEEDTAEAQEIYRFLHNGGPNTPRMMVLYYLADNQRLVYLSEQTGFRHLHVLNPLYESFESLTSGPYEVYPIDISKDRKWVFVRATKEHPSQTDVYKISTRNGRMVRLTKEVGTHTEAAVSQDGTRVLTNLVSYEQLKELVFIDTEAEVAKTLTDSHPEKAHEFAEPSPEFFDFENRHGHKLYGMMFKPDDWKKKDKRPVLIYFYGGPLGTRKMVGPGQLQSVQLRLPVLHGPEAWLCRLHDRYAWQ